MNEVDIERWVDDAPTHQRGFREAVHIILDSIDHSRNLQAPMVMKGMPAAGHSLRQQPLHP